MCIAARNKNDSRWVYLSELQDSHEDPHKIDMKKLSGSPTGYHAKHTMFNK